MKKYVDLILQLRMTAIKTISKKRSTQWFVMKLPGS